MRCVSDYYSFTTEGVIFVVDTSGSMGGTFKADDGSSVTRLAYVAKELDAFSQVLDADKVQRPLTAIGARTRLEPAGLTRLGCSPTPPA